MALGETPARNDLSELGGEARPEAPAAPRGAGLPWGRSKRQRGARESRDREPETRKTASGSYPGRTSNSAPDEGDGTKAARGFPPAWHLRADRRRQTEEGRACDRRGSGSPKDRRSGSGDSGDTTDATHRRPARPRPHDRARQSTTKREGACVSDEMLRMLRGERTTEQSPRPSTGAASNAGERDE